MRSTRTSSSSRHLQSRWKPYAITTAIRLSSKQTLRQSSTSQSSMLHICRSQETTRTSPLTSTTTFRSRSSIRHSYRDRSTGHRRVTVRSASERSRTSMLPCTILQAWARHPSSRRCSQAGSRTYMKTVIPTTTSTGSARNPAGGQTTDSGCSRLSTATSDLPAIMLSSIRNS